jgi:hypothetical protein
VGFVLVVVGGGFNCGLRFVVVVVGQDGEDVSTGAAVAVAVDDPRTTFRRHSLLSLDDQVKQPDGTMVSRRDCQPDRTLSDLADRYAEISDPRLQQIWWRFTDRERTMLYLKGHDHMTWEDAAVMCGGTWADGERLRLKVNYIVKATGRPIT